MTLEEIKHEFLTKQPSIYECEHCPNRGIRLRKCSDDHDCEWAKAMMAIANILEDKPCGKCKYNPPLNKWPCKECDPKTRDKLEPCGTLQELTFKTGYDAGYIAGVKAYRAFVEMDEEEKNEDSTL